MGGWDQVQSRTPVSLSSQWRCGDPATKEFMASYDDARLNRIRRRAQQTADRLADELIAGHTEATGADDELIAEQRWPSPEVAIPALIHIWSRSLHDESLAAARPAIKRSIMTLLQPGYDGHGRAYGDIVGLVAVPPAART